MSASDTTKYNQMYKNIKRPYANVDFSKIPSWDIVMRIMEQQANEAKKQKILMPQSIANYEYQQTLPPYNNYVSNRNTSTEEIDSSSCCSDESMSPATSSNNSDESQSESDIEIDVDSIEEENDDYYVSPMDSHIPITVLQLESKLMEKEKNQS
ncbi:CLUMA_CG012861, isoform A [Clunio marinus]|uniref:CLUMA_CG012861, isoform A n=1 Tax=Clunio marinus TaxID=568069 RepID=A0A1J1IH03_9DIPT|nr:CLUMA_CG012861, isoform A [Clunio marinus]